MDTAAKQKILEQLDHDTAGMTEVESLRFLADKFRGKIRLSTNFGYEDQVITDMICTSNIDIDLFTLDTGRHFEETYKVMNSTRARYEKNIDVYFPGFQLVEELVKNKGLFSFYESVENRKECCHIRKVLPLHRALEGVECWVSGLRSGQSDNRRQITKFMWDETHQLIKYNPLINWTEEQVKSYIREHQVPYHILHDKGYPSIGCAPCTRAVEPGGDIRSGRWWWETDSTKECGIHTDQIDLD